MISGSKFSLRLAKPLFFSGLLILSVGLVSTASIAEEAEKNSSAWNIHALMHSLAQVKESKAAFVERKYLSILNKPLEYSGTLNYQSPGHLEKHTLQPEPESMVLDQDKLVVQSGVAKRKRSLTLQDYPVVWAFVESFRATLAGDMAALNRFYSVTLEGHSTQWLLILRPIDLKMKNMISEIRITGNMAQINTIETREAGGDYSVMSISPGKS